MQDGRAIKERNNVVESECYSTKIHGPFSVDLSRSQCKRT